MCPLGEFITESQKLIKCFQMEKVKKPHPHPRPRPAADHSPMSCLWTCHVNGLARLWPCVSGVSR